MSTHGRQHPNGPQMPAEGDTFRRLSDVAQPRLSTYEEWRITGDPGEGYSPYEFTWSPARNPHLGDDPEKGARGFVRLIESVGGWPDGPHLHKRTVTVTEWEDA